MANICDNKFYISFGNEENAELINDKLEDLFENHLYDGDITYADESVIEGWFESRWSFPEDIFEHFFDDIDDDEIYFRCLSEEYGLNYVAMNIYDRGDWREPQHFKL